MRITVLPKYHQSSVTTLVIRLKKLKLKHCCCAQHYTKRQFYLHLDVRLGPHANTQTAFWFVFFFITHNIATSCNRQNNALVSSWQMPLLGLKSLKINPKRYSIGSLSFITQRSKLGSASHHLLCWNYSRSKAAMLIIGIAQKLHMYYILLLAKTKSRQVRVLAPLFFSLYLFNSNKPFLLLKY